MSQKKNILIIGAGMSGVTCALKLLDDNGDDFKILEASARVGGRLHSFGHKKSSNGRGCNYLEMGSQGVGLGTSMHKVASDLNQIIEDAPNYMEALEKMPPVYGKTGISAIKELRSCFNSMALMPKDFHVPDILKDESLLKAKEICENVGESSFFRFVNLYMHGTYVWWYGLAYAYSFEKIQKELVNGYSGLMQSILKQLPPNTVIPNKEVIKIDWSDFVNGISNPKTTPKIRITCKDESHFQADHVIIAIPLGYIKENYKTLFIPSLPEDKINAIENLNFVTVNKIFLEFETPFWRPSEVFHVIWNDKMDDLFDVLKPENGMSPLEWIKYINRFEYVFTHPNYLCAWIWGEGAKIIENLPDEEIAESCMILLEFLTRKEHLPSPKSVIKSTWYSNHLFRGSVVYDPSTFIHSIAKKVTEPICVDEVVKVPHTSATCILKRPVIQFTGDVGNGIVSSVEGARHGGLRAATELNMYYALQGLARP